MENMPFNEMTDRELIIRLYAKMDNLSDDVSEIKQTLKDRPCPSELCSVHGEDIAKLKYRNQMMAWAFGAFGTVTTLAISIIALVVM